jgi:ABC-type Na+ transport system ATPase subunit NatA
MLEVKQLTRSYGSINAVDNVSFIVGKGEIVSLLGTSRRKTGPRLRSIPTR